MRGLLALLLVALAGCAGNTGVDTSPTFVKAQPVQIKLPEPAVVKPDARVRGSKAVAASLKGVYVEPTDVDMIGTTWKIEAVEHSKIYQVYVAPLSPTTILLPPQETLTSAVAGNPQDFTIETAMSGTRASITVMPNCAHPESTRFSIESETPLVACMTGRSKATFLTSEGPYAFEFVITDWTAVPLVEVNHAPPPKPSPAAPKRPIPTQPAENLRIEPVGKWVPGWAPRLAWADPHKLVVQFDAPLPELPGLYAGLEGESTVNYRVIEDDDAIFLVTDKRVTEAELRIDEQVVRITSARTRELRKPREQGNNDVANRLRREK